MKYFISYAYIDVPKQILGWQFDNAIIDEHPLHWQTINRDLDAKREREGRNGYRMRLLWWKPLSQGDIMVATGNLPG